MKKFFSTMAVAALLLAGVTSCAKDEGAVTEEGTGNLTINFSLKDVDTRAIANSIAKPTTSWGDLSNMMILFTNASGLVEDSRSIPVPTSTAPLGGYAPAVFTDVKANATGWEAYIVGNYPSAWTTSNVVGQNISALTVEALDNDAVYDGSPLGGAVVATGYGEAPELFVSKQTGVIVAEGANNTHATPFKLARAVSQFRLRVDKDGSTANGTVDFSTAEFAVRRATVSYAMNGTYGTVDNYGAGFPGTFAPAAPEATNVFYSTKAMQLTNPGAADYSNNTTIMTGDVDFWNDYLIWAGGGSASENAKRFDIVISGIAPVGYVPFGTTTPLAAATKVYWSGAVDSKMGPNQILEVNVTLSEAGTVTPPPVGAYGNLNITVDLVGWGNIISTHVDM